MSEEVTDLGKMATSISCSGSLTRWAFFCGIRPFCFVRLFLMVFFANTSYAPTGVASGSNGINLRSELIWSGSYWVTDSEARINNALAISSGDTPSYLWSTIGGNFRAYVRYRLAAPSASSSIHFDQAGRTTLTLPSVTDSSTYDGPSTQNGISGYYDVGTLTLSPGAVTTELEGPATGTLFFDQCVLVKEIPDGIGSMTIGTNFQVY